MHLLNLTLQPPTSITHAVIGGFSGTHKQQEIAVCRGGTRVEILKLDETTQRMDTLYSSEAFAGIRSMVPFRLTGQGKGEQISDVRLAVCGLAVDEGAGYCRLPDHRVGFREPGDC
jgi:hypothetical protein